MSQIEINNDTVSDNTAMTSTQELDHEHYMPITTTTSLSISSTHCTSYFPRVLVAQYSVVFSRS